MSNTILIKRSGTANAVPASGNLALGELAINYADGNLFYKDGSNQVKVIASNQFVSVAGNVTAGNVLTNGLISAQGNVTGNYILGNGALLTGVITSVANINNGTSNVTVVTAVTNITAKGRLTGVRKIREGVRDDGRFYTATFQWSERDQSTSEFIRNRMK